MLGLTLFDFADASTLDNKIASYQLNVCFGHPCKVFEKIKFLNVLFRNVTFLAKNDKKMSKINNPIYLGQRGSVFFLTIEE